MVLARMTTETQMDLFELRSAADYPSKRGALAGIRDAGLTLTAGLLSLGNKRDTARGHAPSHVTEGEHDVRSYLHANRFAAPKNP